MRCNPEENTAGRIQFDCELPKEARTGLTRPKRPAILRRPVYQPPGRSSILKWVGGFALSVILLAGAIGHYSQSLKPPATPQPDPVLQHSREILQQPTPAPTTPAARKRQQMERVSRQQSAGAACRAAHPRAKSYAGQTAATTS
jgi:hypothetical protein